MKDILDISLNVNLNLKLKTIQKALLSDCAKKCFFCSL